MEASLDPDSIDASTIRVARRDYDKAVRVPASLREEMARASAESVRTWIEAKATSNFELFLPVLERNVELRRRYIACFEPRDEPYDILLDDFEPEMHTAEVTRIFAEIRDELVPLIAELRDRDVDDSFLTGDFPVDRQVALDHEVVDLFGTARDVAHRSDRASVRVGRRDRRHPDHDALLPRRAQVDLLDDARVRPRALPASAAARRRALPIGSAGSYAMHESQSRLWENMVGRGLPFWRFFYPRVQESFPEAFGDVELERFYAGINKAQPSLIRIEADEVTYGMHVILRFELEQDIVDGRIDLRDLPQLWAERMDAYLGVEVPDDAHGVLQDVHWGAGLIGYFSTYCSAP